MITKQGCDAVAIIPIDDLRTLELCEAIRRARISRDDEAERASIDELLGLPREDE